MSARMIEKKEKKKDYRVKSAEQFAIPIHTAVLFKAISVHTKQWQLSKHRNTNALCYEKRGGGGVTGTYVQ